MFIFSSDDNKGSSLLSIAIFLIITIGVIVLFALDYFGITHFGLINQILTTVRTGIH